MKRIGPAVIMTMLACAPHPRTALQSPRTPACVIADTSALSRDTLYAVGVESPSADSMPGDCERRAAAVAPVLITETPAPETDLRDVLDRGLPATRAPRPDVVVTRDPNVLAYAASSAEYFTVALPYDRTYVLAAIDSAPAAPSQADREALARDAVMADTRGATQPFAWLSPTCTALASPPAAPPRSVVAYASGDAIARQLAERIVALAGARARPAWLPASIASSGAALRVAAIAADSIANAIATGRAIAAVVALPRDPRTRCGTPSVPLAWQGVPLVDSRAHAIVRRGSGAAFIIGVDGTLRFVRRVP
jgi:hypothetical protein